jgi:hypothetical protein
MRDNKINDPTELARLTGIPDLREIWILGNAFTRTHSNYRITIFNLFRKTPGYTEDILIDSYGPGYTERRGLIDRVAERASVPVVKPITHYSHSAVEVNRPVIEYPNPREPSVIRKERPSPVTTLSEVNMTSTGRRRRVPKRRIVDLSTTDTSPSKTKPAVGLSTDEAIPGVAGLDDRFGIRTDPSYQTASSHVPSEPRNTQSQQDVTRIDTSTVPRLPPIESLTYGHPVIKAPSSNDPQDWNISGDIYRKKIEALRNEVGNGWLSVLSEEGWETQRNTQPGMDFSPSSNVRPSATIPRVNGRTLG